MGPDALLKQKMKQKRFRDGYEEGLSSMHKEASAVAFLTSESPVEMLGQFTKSVSSFHTLCKDEQQQVLPICESQDSPSGSFKVLKGSL